MTKLVVTWISLAPNLTSIPSPRISFTHSEHVNLHQILVCVLIFFQIFPKLLSLSNFFSSPVEPGVWGGKAVLSTQVGGKELGGKGIKAIVRAYKAELTRFRIRERFDFTTLLFVIKTHTQQQVVFTAMDDPESSQKLYLVYDGLTVTHLSGAIELVGRQDVVGFNM